MNIRHLQFTLFSIVVSISIFYYLFSKVSPAEVVSVVRNIIPAWLILFLFLSMVKNIYRTWRYKLLLMSSGYDAGSIALFLVTLVRNFFSDLLPARLGTLIYIYLIRSRLNIPLAPAISSFAYSFIFDIISLSLLIMVAVLVASSGNQSFYVILAGGLVLGCISIVVMLILPKCARMAAKICSSLMIIPMKWRAKFHDELIAIEQHLLLAKSHGVYWKVLALSFVVRCCKYLALYVLLLGLVIPLGFTLPDFPLAKVFLGLCSAELASSLPISGIAGFGAYEGAWALVFQLLGYSEKVALLTGISHHLLTQVYGYCLGGLALLTLLLPVFKKKSSQEQVDYSPQNSRRFWGGFILSLLLCTIFALLLVPFGSGL